MSSHVDDDLTYNPFADDTPAAQEAIPRPSNGYFSSAFFPTAGPELRRRRPSESKSDATNTTKDQGRQKSKRSITDIEIIPISTAIHPLKSALAGKYASLFNDQDATRPNLTRRVNESGLSEYPSEDEEDDARTPRSAPEKELNVIVHKVLPTDSLAGVSIKYGITLPNLRRTNQLWTTDSIHLRDELYIPVDLANRAKEYVAEEKLKALTAAAAAASEEDASATHSRDSSGVTLSSTSSDGISETTPPSPPSVSIRKVSTRQLSFFPSPSAKTSPRKRNAYLSEPPASNHALGHQTSTTTPRYNGSPTNSSLASILTALPISASTRDEIITRLSFDSTSSNTTDRSSVNSPDENDGHELEEVWNHRRHGCDDFTGADDFEWSLRTPKVPSLRPNASSMMGTTSLAGPLKRQRSGDRRSGTNTHTHKQVPSFTTTSPSPPRFYVPQTGGDAYIRTSQMEPSPMMKVPPSSPPPRHPMTQASNDQKSQRMVSPLPVSKTSSLKQGAPLNSVMENEMGILAPRV